MTENVINAMSTAILKEVKRIEENIDGDAHSAQAITRSPNIWRSVTRKKAEHRQQKTFNAFRSSFFQSERGGTESRVNVRHNTWCLDRAPHSWRDRWKSFAYILFRMLMLSIYLFTQDFLVWINCVLRYQTSHCKSSDLQDSWMLDQYVNKNI